MCGLGPTLLSEFITNDVLADFVEDMHGSGFLVGATGTYDTEANWRKAQKAGCDFNCSGHDVNPFDANYEVYDTDTDNQPTTTGTNSNGIISLPEGGTITAGSASKIIGKGWLSIRFNGKLTIDFGSQGSNGRTIESDGSEDIVISDYFFMRATSLTITAVSTTSVSRFLYKTSKC